MKMETGVKQTGELSYIDQGLKPGLREENDTPTTNATNGSHSVSENPANEISEMDNEIKEHPEKFFEMLSSKIEDQLRMLEWEMTSNFQEAAISDFLGNGLYENESSLDQDVSGGYFEIGNSYSEYPSAGKDESRKMSRDFSLRSSVSSVSSILDEDDKRSDIGADGDVENNTSESSRSDSVDSGKGAILAASITLVEGDRRQKQTLDSFISQMVTSIMQDISTIFTDDRDAILWARAYDSNIVPTMSTSYNQYYNETDKNVPHESREVLFSKSFSGDQVTFSDDRWFPHDEIFKFPASGNHRLQEQSSVAPGVVRRRSQRRDVAFERSDEPERRIFHRARYQMHDIHHELKRLSCRLHDIKDDRAESSDATAE